MSQLAQLGLVGYDQWQVTGNGGNYLVAGIPVSASRVPYYSVHGIGFSGQLHSPGEGLRSLLQVLRRVFGQGPSAGTHYRVWLFVDVADSEATGCKAATYDQASQVLISSSYRNVAFCHMGGSGHIPIIPAVSMGRRNTCSKSCWMSLRG